jgi:hypothetical protein
VESELKEKFLELLDKDKEFRYAVAAYLGLADILRRLDSKKPKLNSRRNNRNENREE